MAGLVGRVNQMQPPDADRSRIPRMLAALAHRGRDTRGAYFGDICALGVCQHLPLDYEAPDPDDPDSDREPAILSGASRLQQPYAEGRKDIRIIFDGVLTNARDARAEWATQTGKAGDLVQNTEMDLIREGFGDQMSRMLLGSFGRKRRQVSSGSKAEDRARQMKEEENN